MDIKTAKILVYLENADDTRRSTEHIAYVLGCSYAVAHQKISVLRAGELIVANKIGKSNKNAYTLTDEGRDIVPEAKEFLEEKGA